MAQKSKNMDAFSSKIMKSAWNEIKKAKSITFLTHFRPDADGISSCAALSHIFEKHGKKVESICPSKPDFKFKRKPKNLLINKHKQIPQLIMILDTANYERCYFPKEFKKIPTINIDHHISNQIKATYNFIDPDASSTCEMIFTLFKIWNNKLIDKYAAECLLFGILADSQVFHTQAATPHTLHVSAELMELGANLYKLKTELISNKNPKIINFWGKILSNIKITKKGKVAWVSIKQSDLKKDNLQLSSLSGFNNFLSQISDVDVTLLFYQTESNQTKVSLRAKKTDVNKLASKFGGGGHKNAAGILTDKPVDKLIKEVLKQI